MGKKPLVGVVGTLWLGLSLAGCESCGCGQKAYQAPNGGLRSLVSGTSQPNGQTASQTSSPSSSQAWNNQPRSTTTTPAYNTGTAAPLPTGPASNAGSLVPASGVDGKNAVPPAVNTNTPVSSTSWPMKPAADSGIQQTSATAPAAPTDAAQPAALPLTSPQPKGSLSTSQRMSDGYANSNSDSSSNVRSLPPPPPMPRSLGASSASATSAPAADANPALMAPPPPPPPGVTTSSLPPVGSPSVDIPSPPPVPNGPTLK